MIMFNQVELRRGTKVLFTDSDLMIHPGQKVALVGANGCGKSSLFALLRDQIHQDQGDVSIPKHWKTAWVQQETPETTSPVTEYVIQGDEEYCQLRDQLSDAEIHNLGDKIAEIHEKLDAIHAYSIVSRAESLLHGLGFSQEQLSEPVNSFSGGWRMRMNLAKALMCRSDLLLLDEPTNHLDLDAVFWLEKWLNSYPGTLILISHDKEFIDGVAKRLIHIERQSLNMYESNYSGFERIRAEKLALQQAQYEKQQKHIAHLQKFITRFKAKASKAKQAQSRVKSLEKMEMILPAHMDSPFSFEFSDPEQLPNPITFMEDVKAGYGEKVILDKVHLNLVPGSRIGLLGRNGAGKSTLIKLLAQHLQPMTGNYQTNKGLKIGYFAQHQLELLDPDASPIEHIQRIDAQIPEQKIRDYLGGFDFSGDKATDKVRPFSGGEKARLVLALIVFEKPNLLLLDEPTNHLDLDMRHALSLALQSFEGAMVIVSHDRYMLRSVCDDYYLVHDGQVSRFHGDLDDYHTWLNQSGDKAAAKSEDKPANVDKKQLKRLQAEFRQKTSPMKKKLNQLETKVEKLTTTMEEIEQAMADPAIYEASEKDRLTQLIQRQAETKQQLDEAEMEWMELQEELEQMEQEFNASN